MINFNVPPFVGTEIQYIQEALQNHRICGDGPFTMKCSQWLQERFQAKKALLTTSGSAALDMAALLCEIQPGDEVILPSFTFSSTANAFLLAGARLVFTDIRPDTMNLDESRIEEAITQKTKVIVPVHYAGVSCDMDTILSIAGQYHLKVVEDAAQAVMSSWNGKPLGTIGDFGCYSFHETKNYSMGEGGAILINDENYIERAEILREKGTNRTQFYRGQIAKYNWVDIGDSFLQSDLNAAHLWAQLQEADRINDNRMSSWNQYFQAFQDLQEKELVQLPFIPDGCVHNAHMFYLLCPDLEVRQAYIAFMREHGIQCVFHYVPLHSAPAGRKYGRFHGEDRYTTSLSERLGRLPLYFHMEEKDILQVIDRTRQFFSML